MGKAQEWFHHASSHGHLSLRYLRVQPLLHCFYKKIDSSWDEPTKRNPRCIGCIRFVGRLKRDNNWHDSKHYWMAGLSSVSSEQRHHPRANLWWYFRGWSREEVLRGKQNWLLHEFLQGCPRWFWKSKWRWLWKHSVHEGKEMQSTGLDENAWASVGLTQLLLKPRSKYRFRQWSYWEYGRCRNSRPNDSFK